MDQIHQKLGVIQYSEITALLFSVSLLVSKFNYDVSYKLRNLLASKLQDEIELDKKGDIPTLCFSLSSLVENELEPSQ